MFTQRTPQYFFAPAFKKKCKFKLKYGGVVERLITAVLKTAVPERVPGVRIPAPPHSFSCKL
jgi:hypothetical protein